MYTFLNFEMEDFMFNQATAYFVLILSLLLMFYWYLTRNFNFWSERNIPGEKPVPIFGTSSKSWKTATHEALQTNYRKHGKVYGGYEGSTPVLYTGDPDMIKTVFIKEFNNFADRRIFPKTGDAIFDNLLIFMRGDESKGVRNVMTPTFSSKKLRQMYPLIEECSEKLVKNMNDIVETDNGAVDAKKLFSAFTTDVIARCAFGTEIDSYRDPTNPFVVNSKKIFGGNVGIAIVLSLFAPWLLSLLRLDVLPRDSMDFFKAIIEGLIIERKNKRQMEQNIKRCDFLQLILETEESDELTGITESNKKELSTDMILSQCVLFFLAGFETTASALAYASYLLALNPESQDKLIRELDNAFLQNKGVLTSEVVASLPYLEGVVNETLRLYPPFSYLLRTCSGYCDVAGIPFYPGMMVNIPIYAIHRDADYFPDPETFMPERFLPENKETVLPYTYLPFGTGPRNCLGLRLAILEIKAALAHTLRHVRFQATEKTKGLLMGCIVSGGNNQNYLLQTITDHKLGINCMALSDDGSLLVTGSDDTTARMWSTESMPIECLGVLRGHYASITCCSVFKQFVVTGSADLTIRKWSIGTGFCLFVYQGHESRISRVLATCGFIFSTSYDRTIRAWFLDASMTEEEDEGPEEDRSNNLKGGVRVFEGHERAIFAVIFVPSDENPLNGNAIYEDDLVISGSADSTARSWSMLSGECVHIFKGHGGPVNCLATDSNYESLYTGSADSLIKQWNLRKGTCLRDIKGHRGPIFDLRVYPNRMMYSASSDHTARAWVMEFAQCVRIYRGHKLTTTCLRYLDGMIFTGCGDQKARMFESKSGTLKRTFAGHESLVACIEVVRGKLFTASYDGKLCVWDTTGVQDETVFGDADDDGMYPKDSAYENDDSDSVRIAMSRLDMFLRNG